MKTTLRAYTVSSPKGVATPWSHGLCDRKRVFMLLWQGLCLCRPDAPVYSWLDAAPLMTLDCVYIRNWLDCSRI